jgi:hypothetical protein
MLSEGLVYGYQSKTAIKNLVKDDEKSISVLSSETGTGTYKKVLPTAEKRTQNLNCGWSGPK